MDLSQARLGTNTFQVKIYFEKRLIGRNLKSGLFSAGFIEIPKNFFIMQIWAEPGKICSAHL